MTFVLNLKSAVSQRVYLSKLHENRQNRMFPLPRKAIPFILFGLGLVLISSSVYFIVRGRTPQTKLEAVPAKVRFAAPELTLTDTQGVSRSLADYRGQVVLVNLWATWCPPCKEEMPTLQAFYDKYRESGFVIVAINDGDPKADVLQFVKDYELTFPVWLDPTYIATEEAFNTLNLPTSFVIDRGGTIQLTWVGGIDADALETYVTPLITEPS
jgi:thiol-disulfide isomerase/thioredoxin